MNILVETERLLITEMTMDMAMDVHKNSLDDDTRRFVPDILCYAMHTLRSARIVAHVHDELIIECNPKVSLETVCEQMGGTPPWAPGLVLRADGDEMSYYMKT